ncbi:helix-turn-helix domain-containing protein [Streptomyces sp. NPDC001315]|uniref:helix-turn-helix domain-containing protein n=1 Tax=Streptomyces sp. NPDC001315 TaxID=3364562 RepID=UPI0036D1A303
MASLNVGNLGEYLREQRRNAQLSLRQLADAAGVSNPYLSQIERGLRKPSAEVLQQVAKALRISAETLYVHAGILDAERDRDEVETRAVILADPTLNEGQKQVLLQVYESFRKENGFEAAPATAPATAPGDRAGTVDTADVPDTSDPVDADDEPDGARHAADRDDDSVSESAVRRTRKTPARRTRPVGGSGGDPQQTAS